jgi:hypothetical protein
VSLRSAVDFGTFVDPQKNMQVAHCELVQWHTLILPTSSQSMTVHIRLSHSRNSPAHFPSGELEYLPVSPCQLSIATRRRIASYRHHREPTHHDRTKNRALTTAVSLSISIVKVISVCSPGMSIPYVGSTRNHLLLKPVSSGLFVKRQLAVA